MIMNLRDTMFAQAPYLLAAKGEHPGLGELHEQALASVSDEVREQVERPFIGSREGSEHAAEDGYTFDGHRTTAAELPIIDQDALWSCTTCGACVEQCPVDIELLGQDVADASEVDYLFWVGCAGAYEDRAKKTTRAVAELLNAADPE